MLVCCKASLTNRCAAQITVFTVLKNVGESHPESFDCANKCCKNENKNAT